MESTKRLYAYSTNTSKSLQKWHSISHAELNRLYRGVGWIGRRRQPVTYHRPPLRDDRGPGVQHGR